MVPLERTMMKPIFITTLGILSLALSGCNIQARLLYFPGEMTVQEVHHRAEGSGLLMWPEPGAKYLGILSAEGPAHFRGTVVVFHGNAGEAIFRRYYIDALESLGYRVVLAEYPGYGGRPGELSEKSFVADARQTALLARKLLGGPLYLWGESLGCGIASALAADQELRPDGVVMLTPWDCLLNEAKAQFPLLPVRLFLRDTYDNVANLSAYKGPVAVIMAGRDEIIPNRLTQRLYASLSQPKRLWVFPESGHNDWPGSPELPWWREVMDFLASGGDRPGR